MCEVCRCDPCDNLCPNAKQRKVVGICAVCGSDIISGDEIYELNDAEAIHADCVQGLSPVQAFDAIDTNPDAPFRYSDIEGSTFLELFGIEKEVAE